MARFIASSRQIIQGYFQRFGDILCQLPTLRETEKYIKEKGHLPGISSAAEVKTNGIDLGEMNAKLLKKIEELTLHVIQLSQEVKVLQKKILPKKHK